MPRRASSNGQGGRRSVPRFDDLEGRLLLSRDYPIPLGPPPNVKIVQFGRDSYTVRLDGPGMIRARKEGESGVALTLLGTTQDTVLTVTPRLQRPIFQALGLSSPTTRPHRSGDPLPITKLDVRTGLLGGIDGLTSADLVGPVSPLRGSVAFVRLNTIGPNARLQTSGDLGELTAGAIDLGSAGRVEVRGDLVTGMNVQELRLEGGQVLIGDDIEGSARIGRAEITDSGRFFVGGDVETELLVREDLRIAGGGSLGVANDAMRIEVQGRLIVAPGGEIEVGRDLRQLVVGEGLEVGGGRLAVGNDLGALEVASELVVADGGRFETARDLAGQVRVGGSVRIATQGLWRTGRDVSIPIDVQGDFVATAQGTFCVSRNLAGLLVRGDLVTTDGGSALYGGTVGLVQVGGVTVGDGLVQGDCP